MTCHTEGCDHYQVVCTVPPAAEGAVKLTYRLCLRCDFPQCTNCRSPITVRTGNSCQRCGTRIR